MKNRAPEAFREAHSRLYDFYRYQGLPSVFHEPIAYALLADQCHYPRIGAKRTIEELLSGRMNEATKALIPKALVAAPSKKLREAAALIDTAAFNEALRKFLPDDLNGMRPCFSAITHGCAAGQHQEAFREIYAPRVRRGEEAFISHKLGAVNADLAVLAPFFDSVWSTPAQGLRELTKARLLAFAAFALRAVGRLREAVEPFEASLKANIDFNDAKEAGRDASNLSELRLIIGDIAGSIATAQVSVAYADESGDAFHRTTKRITLANALHQAGRAREASKMFEEAEAMQARRQPSLPKLYGLQGYRYCDLLLAQGHVRAVIERAKQTLDWGERGYGLLDFALDNFSLGRAYATMSSRTGQRSDPGSLKAAAPVGILGRDDDAERVLQHLDDSVERLRRAGQEDQLAGGLLARAGFRRAVGEHQAAETDLNEAHELAVYGEMRLHLTDYHLESARLTLAQIAAAPEAAETQSMRAKAEEHYTAAKKLIDDTGYKRRLPELEAIRACLDGEIPASILDPDRDKNGRPAAAV